MSKRYKGWFLNDLRTPSMCKLRGRHSTHRQNLNIPRSCRENIGFTTAVDNKRIRGNRLQLMNNYQSSSFCDHFLVFFDWKIKSRRCLKILHLCRWDSIFLTRKRWKVRAIMTNEASLNSRVVNHVYSNFQSSTIQYWQIASGKLIVNGLRQLVQSEIEKPSLRIINRWILNDERN